MSYYVGAEPRNDVQKDKFFRGRIDAEEGAAVRATASSLRAYEEKDNPITWRKTPVPSRLGTAQSAISGFSGSYVAPLRNLASRGKDVLLTAREDRSEAGSSTRRVLGLPKPPSRLGTGMSRISAGTSVSAATCRSTVLSMELEIERERREAAEKELTALRQQLAMATAAAAGPSAPAAVPARTPRGAGKGYQKR
eukprot:TRINITY_DN93100_c0_g1_i1.p1 TRINITY_DN93100_c0_g1~~TRINITY_DN93100_c0_g1_i1.p1  ORF type:complete len:195 (-),score=27.87 TRINITY_DN93100_c0_g1_i1:26-610(-)